MSRESRNITVEFMKYIKDCDEYPAFAKALEKPENGKYIMTEGLYRPIQIEDCRISFLSPTSQYAEGNSIEGAKLLRIVQSGVVRVAYFHPKDNYQRLRNSVAAQGHVFPKYSNEQMAIRDMRLVYMNGWDENWPARTEADGPARNAAMLYVRPFAYVKHGIQSIGVLQPCPLEVSTAVLPLFSYLGEKAEENEAKVYLFPIERIAAFPNDKSSTNYSFSGWAKKIAVEQYGCDEVLFLKPRRGREKGQIIETSGQTPFIYNAKTKTVVLPPFKNGRLDGITALNIKEIAEKSGYRVVEKRISVDDVKNADGFYLCGNATVAVRVGTLIMTIGDKAYSFQIGKPAGKTFFDEVIKGAFLTEVLSEGSTKYGNWLVYLDDVFPDREIDNMKKASVELRQWIAENKLANQKLAESRDCEFLKKAGVYALPWGELHPPKLRRRAFDIISGTDPLYVRKRPDAPERLQRRKVIPA